MYYLRVGVCVFGWLNQLVTILGWPTVGTVPAPGYIGQDQHVPTFVPSEEFNLRYAISMRSKMVEIHLSSS